MLFVFFNNTFFFSFLQAESIINSRGIVEDHEGDNEDSDSNLQVRWPIQRSKQLSQDRVIMKSLIGIHIGSFFCHDSIPIHSVVNKVYKIEDYCILCVHRD